MSKASRLERLDGQRAELEAQYLNLLIDALQATAAGSWGLFAHKTDRWTIAKWREPVRNLCDLGQEIDRMRASLGLERFGLHAEFEASRGPVSSNAPGEPKQAAKWLEKLGRPVVPHSG